MTVAVDELQKWLDAKEDELQRIFAEASPDFSAEICTRARLDDLDPVAVVDFVHREQPVPDLLKSRVDHLLEQGIIERLGRGRGVRLLLSQRFYRRLGKAGVYTRKRGLDRETNKALLVRHLQESGDAGCPISELQQVLPDQSRDHRSWLR